MIRRIAWSASIFCVAFTLSGCFGIGDKSDPRGAAALLISTDNGASFVPSVMGADGKVALEGDILTMTIDPKNPNRIFVGTRASQIAVSDDGGATWQRLPFPPQRVYGIVVDTENTDVLYATGVYSDFGKIYKSSDRGQKWDEIYTEPVKESVVTTLAIDPARPRVLYAGTSKGVILRSDDAGQNWRDIYNANAPVTAIVMDARDTQTVYFLLFQKGLLKSRDGGNTVEDFTPQLAAPQQRTGTIVGSSSRRSTKATAIAVDPVDGGIVYVGTDQGILRSADYGATWTALDTIGSANRLAVQMIAINPHDRTRIVYGVARTLYFSGASMGEWTPIQISGTRIPSVLRYDPVDVGTVYVGMQKG